MTTDRFYGGVTNRLENLQACLMFIQSTTPTRNQLIQWVINNTRASSVDAVSHHLTFLDAIDLIELDDTTCELATYGEQWLGDRDPDTLYTALTEGVKGFDTILEALAEEPWTDTELMDLLVSEFDEAEMTKPGPAIRHREWLQVLGYATREGDTTYITDVGREALATHSTNTYRATHSPPPGVEVGDQLIQPEIEATFDTGFGYQISGINPRRDVDDSQYLLVFANEDGPYADDVTQGQFEYIGEGLEGDQTASSPGNSVLIDAIDDDIPVHFFYQATDSAGWAYQGLVDVLGYDTEQRDGREVIVFSMVHQQATTPDDGVETTEADLRSKLDAEPQLTSDEEFTKQERRVRDQAFARIVKSAYDNRCAVCDTRRETPAGTPEVEAAHIYPRSEQGADDPRNGLALCKLHHWAFDSGWLSITDAYTILVADAPDRAGYHEFKQLEGRQITLPDDDELRPHAQFLAKHREIHGF